MIIIAPFPKKEILQILSGTIDIKEAEFDFPSNCCCCFNYVRSGEGFVLSHSHTFILCRSAEGIEVKTAKMPTHTHASVSSMVFLATFWDSKLKFKANVCRVQRTCKLIQGIFATLYSLPKALARRAEPIKRDRTQVGRRSVWNL